MPDVVDAATRSRMMSGIRGKNTKPEREYRKCLFALGFRYRLHPKNLPGRPDIVLPKYNAAVFVHGCFWHGHDCHLYRVPGTNTEFWLEKIQANRVRDLGALAALKRAGWRTLVIWECAARGRFARSMDEIARVSAAWIKSGRKSLVIAGQARPASKNARESNHAAKTEDSL
jgi:DNA mismatch endonuclease, patch repair protein